MKLYVFPVAPNPTRVRLYLAEKAVGVAPLEVEEVFVDVRKGEQKQAEHLARNPFGRLPVLELDDGGCLTESAAIIEYFEELYPEPPMIGESPLERARCRELDRVAELGVLLPVARIVHATSSPFGLPPNPAVAEFYGAYVQKSLGFLDGKLADGRPFVAGDRPTVGDCTLQAAFQFARYGQVDVLKDHEHLASWDAAFRDRESARAVLMLQDFLVGRVTAAPHR